ncbi:unnamed protein product [Prunus brigantina]
MASIPFCQVFPFLSPLIPSIILFWDLGAQGPFPAAALVKSSYFQISPFSSFLPSFIVRSEEGKKWVYVLVRRVAPCVPISFSPLDILLENLFLPSQQLTWSSKLLHGFVFQPNAETFAASYF